ncbi:hypothetical protein [Jeotgalibacillus marinus]|uniref:Permease n=1 Tax=Jeotgalibacillus marinus TaxID=86667 RepID=A0ABV3Q2X9_9BACL
MKRFIKYLICSLIVILVLYFGSEIYLRLEEYRRSNFELRPLMLFIVLFPILVGMMIRFPQLVTDIRLKKGWSIDWVKLSAIGIPSLYIALSPLLLILNVPIIHQVRISFLMSGFLETVTTIAGVIFGYVLLDSLKEK